MADGVDGPPQDQLSPEQQLVAMALEVLRTLAPRALSDEDVAKVLRVAFGQEQAISQFWDFLLPQHEVDRRPLWGFELSKATGEAHRFFCPKRLDEKSSASDLGLYAAAMGLLMSPIPRAVLMSHGWRVQLLNASQTPLVQPPPIGKIIL